MTVLVTILGVVIALLVLLVAGLLRSHAEILRSLHGLGVDLDPDASEPAPGTESQAGPGLTVARPRAEQPTASDVAGVAPNGDAVSISIIGAKQPTLLAFLTSGCSTCVEFWNAFADSRRTRPPGDARIVVVTKGSDGESPARLRKFVPPDVPVVMSSEAWDAYDVPVAPYFAFVDGSSGLIVGEGAAATWDHLVSMMEQALADAGIESGRRNRRTKGSRSRDTDVDHALLASGIKPGHPSLYPATERDLHVTQDPT